MQQNAVSVIDPRIARELRPGEQLLWSGKPDLASMSQLRVVRIFSLRFWFLSFTFLFLLLADMVCLLFSLPPGTVTQVNLLGPVIFISILLLFFLWQVINVRFVRGRIQVQLKELQHMIYVITNLRIVEIVGNETPRVLSSSKADIGKIERIETRNGRGDIVYSTPPVSPISPMISLTTGRMVGIPDIRAVQEILLKTFKDTE